MTPIARILTRFQGDGDGIFIGSLFKAGAGALKPNTIYEVRDVLGVLTIVEIGRATGAGPNNCSATTIQSEGVQFSWYTTIGEILDLGSTIFLTEKEYEKLPLIEDL